MEWAFTTRDGAWGAAQTIADIPLAFSATYGSPAPGLAVAEDGRVMAVWASVDAAGSKLEWSLFVPGQGWSAKQAVPGAPTTLVGASLVSDAGGNVVALVQGHTAGGDIWATRYTSGLGWDVAPVTLTATSGTAALYTGSLAGAADGTALAVWIESGAEGRVWARRYTPEAGWSEPVVVNGGACTPARSVDVALNASGEDIVAVAGASTVCARRDWSDPAAAATLGSGSGAVTPAVALDDLGNGLVGYLSGAALYTSRCPAGAGCGAGSNLADAERVAALAMNGLGDTLALWPSAGELRGSRFTWDAGWSVAVPVADSPGNTRTPSLAIERSGNATAVWEYTDGTRRDIWASRYTGQQWSTAGAIETDTSYNASAPRVGVDAMGRATAIWIQSDATGGPKVMYNRFE